MPAALGHVGSAHSVTASARHRFRPANAGAHASGEGHVPSEVRAGTSGRRETVRAGATSELGNNGAPHAGVRMGGRRSTASATTGSAAGASSSATGEGTVSIGAANPQRTVRTVRTVSTRVGARDSATQSPGRTSPGRTSAGSTTVPGSTKPATELSSAHRSGRTTRRGSATAPKTTETGTSARTTSGTASGTGTGTSARTTSGTASGTGTGTSAPTTSGTASGTGTGTSAPTTSGTANGTGTGTSAPTTSSTGTGAYPGSGSIVTPLTSVSFVAAGGGTVSAQATWNGAPTLQLEIACPGGISVARTGTSGLSIELDDTEGGGTCTVTLSLPPGMRADVSYTLVVDPAPRGA